MLISTSMSSSTGFSFLLPMHHSSKLLAATARAHTQECSISFYEGQARCILFGEAATVTDTARVMMYLCQDGTHPMSSNSIIGVPDHAPLAETHSVLGVDAVLHILYVIDRDGRWLSF